MTGNQAFSVCTEQLQGAPASTINAYDLESEPEAEFSAEPTADYLDEPTTRPLTQQIKERDVIKRSSRTFGVSEEYIRGLIAADELRDREASRRRLAREKEQPEGTRPLTRAKDVTVQKGDGSKPNKLPQERFPKLPPGRQPTEVQRHSIVDLKKPDSQQRSKQSSSTERSHQSSRHGHKSQEPAPRSRNQDTRPCRRDDHQQQSRGHYRGGRPFQRDRDRNQRSHVSPRSHQKKRSRSRSHTRDTDKRPDRRSTPPPSASEIAMRKEMEQLKKTIQGLSEAFNQQNKRR